MSTKFTYRQILRNVHNILKDAIRVTPISDGNLLEGIEYDYYTRVLSGTDNEIETWTYRNGGSGGTIVAVVVATYTDSYRDDLVTVDRTT